MRTFRALVAVAMTLAATSCKVDSLLFESDPVSQYLLPTDAGIAPQYATQVAFFSGHDTLYALYFRRPTSTGPRITVLLSHGRNGNLVRDPELARASMLFNNGYDVLAYDYRGYGLSTGSSSGETSLDTDAAAAYDYLTNDLAVAGSTVILYGHSIGAVPTLTLALAHPGSYAVVLESAFTSGAAMQQTGTLVDLPVQWFLGGTYDNIDRIAGVTSPVLILHGVLDREVPVTQATTLYDRTTASKRLEIDPQGDHDNIPSHLGSGVLATLIGDIVASAPPSIAHATRLSHHQER